MKDTDNLDNLSIRFRPPLSASAILFGSFPRVFIDSFQASQLMLLLQKKTPMSILSDLVIFKEYMLCTAEHYSKIALTQTVRRY